MADEFAVTLSNLIYRLKHSGWITIPNNSKQIYLDRKLPE